MEIHGEGPIRLYKVIDDLGGFIGDTVAKITITFDPRNQSEVTGVPCPMCVITFFDELHDPPLFTAKYVISKLDAFGIELRDPFSPRS